MLRPLREATIPGAVSTANSELRAGTATSGGATEVMSGLRIPPGRISVFSEILPQADMNEAAAAADASACG